MAISKVQQQKFMNATLTSFIKGSTNLFAGSEFQEISVSYLRQQMRRRWFKQLQRCSAKLRLKLLHEMARDIIREMGAAVSGVAAKFSFAA